MTESNSWAWHQTCSMILPSIPKGKKTSKVCKKCFDSELLTFKFHCTNSNSLDRATESRYEEMIGIISNSENAHRSGNSCTVCEPQLSGSASSSTSSCSSGYSSSQTVTDNEPLSSKRAPSSYDCIKHYVTRSLPVSLMIPTAQLAVNTIAPPANIGCHTTKLFHHTSDDAHVPFHKPGLPKNTYVTDKQMAKAFGIKRESLESDRCVYPLF